MTKLLRVALAAPVAFTLLTVYVVFDLVAAVRGGYEK